MARGFGGLRRDDLLRTACDVIAARGFGHTRTVDIAQAAGVSQALLFYHFETEEKPLAQAFTCADPDGSTWRIISLIDGLSTQMTVHRRVLPRARMAELVRTATAAEPGLPPDALS
ncbi:AcrR family transcriptional regulator [Streptosporangium album]|uniref:AcrR family transcriptional regulator n=1 Tax=Streptosporangium album TaxID=47479 RepID=A0A7W7RQ29_9ACTN|nr:TetR/AcrR family transcriptional regulator [Streptosporangium album]MBB4936109.1 AcrR family transcriptional regulator [Streptosporangium album]